MNKPTILIVDDEENILNALKRLLRKEPFEVVTTTSAKQAIRFLECVKVSLVITDQRMDGVTGDDVINQAREKCPGVKFIKLTGYSDGSGSVPRNGAYEVVSKPWNDEELKVLIKKALESSFSESLLTTAT